MKRINSTKAIIFCLVIVPLWAFANDSINEIELFDDDYEVVNYTEIKMRYNENILQIGLVLKITNSEKLNELKNSTNPIIYINFNNQKYMAKGNFIFKSSLEFGCDFCFPIDENGRITFFKDETIYFIRCHNKK